MTGIIRDDGPRAGVVFVVAVAVLAFVAVLIFSAPRDESGESPEPPRLTPATASEPVEVGEP